MKSKKLEKYADLPPMNPSSNGVWVYDNGEGETLVHFWHIEGDFAGVCEYPTGQGWSSAGRGMWRRADVQEEPDSMKPYNYESKCVRSDKQTKEFINLAKEDFDNGNKDSVTFKLVHVTRMLNKIGVADLDFYIPVAYGLGTGVVYVPAKNLTNHEAVKKAEAKGKKMAEEFWLIEVDGKHYWRIWYD